MKDIVDKLKPVTAKVSTILDVELLGSAILKLELLGSNRTTTQKSAMDRPITSPDIIEPKLYGRDNQKKSLIDDIVHGQYFANHLVVLPIVGPGGIGKTTFTQHVYDEVKSHFDVAIWICVSLSFDVSRLAQEAVKKIPKVDNEKENSSPQELIELRLKTKRFLLVLDDMWTCQEDEWKKLLAPFRRGEEKGNMVIVTTRIPEVAEMVRTVNSSIQMGSLSAEDFMHFFEECVFGKEEPWKNHPCLLDVGKKIVSFLKGFPLAAKTVGRLLRKQLTLDHWTRVLESKEWELQTNDNDIMPALKLSYDYLPFHLQQCFSYCSLFPEDYEFRDDELIHFWIGLDILHSSGQNKRTEDIGRIYLSDLVNHGFFNRTKKDAGTHYVIHDLLHNLAVRVSSYECITILSSNVRSIQIPTSIRHLSIIIDDKEVENRMDFDNFKKELRELDKRLNVENLRTLMLFGTYHGSFAKSFGDLFVKAGSLRTIYLSGASYIVEDILHNFSKLVHLRYIKIKSPSMEDNCLLNALSKLYHLEIIDLQEWRRCAGSARHISNLIKLRHFLVPDHKIQLHSNIVEAGKLKFLMELSHFEIGKERKGFEPSQLGKLSELGGSLDICNIERVNAINEAAESKMVHKNHLHKLTLEWDVKRPNKDPTQEEKVLEIMKPHNNIQGLCIRGHGGTKCPKWLGEKLSVDNLEALCLDGVAWKIFPPIGELWLVNEAREEIPGNMTDTKFQKLERLELIKLHGLKKWVGDTPCQLFSHLKVLIIRDCSELAELSFSHSTCCQQEKDANMSWFPKLQKLEIEGCPKLLSFPPFPWTSALCSARIKGVGLGFEELVCRENERSGYTLKIKGNDGLDRTVWKLLAFDNLTELKELEMDRCPPLPVQRHFEMLSSLRALKLFNSSSIVIPLVEGEGCAKYQFPIECVTIHKWDASAKELTHLLTYFPKLSELNVFSSEKITGLGVVEKQAAATPVAPSPSANKVNVAQIEPHQQQDDTRGEGGIAAEGLLLLPSRLQKLEISSDPVDFNRQAGRTGGGQGLQGLTSLRSLEINGNLGFLSSYSSYSSSPCFPFPTSLQHLSITRVEGMQTLLPLSNLTSLSSLYIYGCGDLRGEGLRPLLAQGHLTRLTVHNTPNFFAGSEPSPPHEQELPFSSSKLRELQTDDITGVLAGSICTLLSSSLTELHFWWDKEVERFTKEQEEALQLLTSLEIIRFWDCNEMQGLPAGLHRLPNLKRLGIFDCAAIRSLPKDGLPSSLQELKITSCPAIRSIPKECLPNSLQKLDIINCPAIRSLPKVGDLPSSLRELHICDSKSKELRRQCRKLIGTIPTVRA
ncbi:unnamed protein product [Urochloa humidicola]